VTKYKENCHVSFFFEFYDSLFFSIPAVLLLLDGCLYRARQKVTPFDISGNLVNFSPNLQSLSRRLQATSCKFRYNIWLRLIIITIWT